MVDGIANDVDQRVPDILHHLAVEFDLAPARDELHLLPHVLRKIPDDTRQRGK